MCSVCGTEKENKRRVSEAFIQWQKAYMASDKRRKQIVKANQKSARLEFEFSLQTQQKALTERQ